MLEGGRLFLSSKGILNFFYILNREYSVLRDMLNIYIFCSQMMEMSREVWKSSPNVIAHIEMEAKKHHLDDKQRWRKVEQLKVSLFIINFIFSVSKLVLRRILCIFFWAGIFTRQM